MSSIKAKLTRLAQSKLNEVVGGAVPLQGGSGTFDEDSDWHWSVDASQNDVANLWTVTVTVTRPSSGGEEISSTLTQMVLDPSIRGSVFDAVAVTGSADTAPSGGSNASGSGGSSGQGGAAGGGAMGGGAMGGGAGKGGGSMGGGSKGGGGGTMGGGSKSGGTTGGTGGGSKSGGGTTGGGSKGGAAAGGSKGG